MLEFNRTRQEREVSKEKLLIHGTDAGDMGQLMELIEEEVRVLRQLNGDMQQVDADIQSGFNNRVRACLV